MQYPYLVKAFGAPMSSHPTAQFAFDQAIELNQKHDIPCDQLTVIDRRQASLFYTMKPDVMGWEFSPSR